MIPLIFGGLGRQWEKNQNKTVEISGQRENQSKRTKVESIEIIAIFDISHVKI